LPPTQILPWPLQKSGWSNRIALISEHASPFGKLGSVDSGGQNQYVSHLARQLSVLGYRVDIFTRRDSSLLPDVAAWSHGVRIIHVNAGPPEPVAKEDLLPYMQQFTAQVLKRCRSGGGYDLIHANFWMSALVAAEIKRELGTPFVVTFHALGRVRRAHQGVADRFPDERFDIEDRVVQEADHIVAECPQDEEDLIRLYNAEPAKITTIPCGFDQSEFWPISKTLARARLGLDPDEKILLQLGRMVPRKGVDNAIRALGRLERNHGIPARLLIVGGESDGFDPEVERLRGIADEEGVEDRTVFVGPKGRESLKYYYNAADMFLTTPWYEPFGITAVEAMACGTPVIGSNVGGIKFTVRENETGYLVNPKDPEALAERIAHLYRNPKLRDRLGRQGVQRANTLFTWEKVAWAASGLYERVLLQKRSMNNSLADQLNAVDRGFAATLSALQETHRRLRPTIAAAADLISETFESGGKLLVCGNGGSAADAQHFAAEFVGRFKQPGRGGLPAMALCADSAVLTAWANDSGYEKVFARQVEAFGRPGDLLVVISTSGRSINLVEAVQAARAQNLRSIAVLGGSGGSLRQLADLCLVVPASDTQQIQEVQMVILHLVCELVENRVVAAVPIAGASSRSGRRRHGSTTPGGARSALTAADAAQ
jgi:D-inositol-3-phosphate glycosyltransferase